MHKQRPIALFFGLGLALTVVVAAMAPSPDAAAAAAHPDLNGRWILNMDRSAFGKVPGGQPISRSDLIEQHEPRIVQTLFMENPSSTDTAVYHYVTDSSKVVNKVGGQSITSRVWWENGVLRVESKTKLLIFDTTLSERWTLSPSGRMLTIARKVKWPGGGGEQNLIFDRKPIGSP